MTARTVVIGVGNRFRRDDGFGPMLLDLIKSDLPADVIPIESDGEPSHLLDAWSGARLAVVIESVRGAGDPGTVVLIGATDGSSEPLLVGRQAGTHTLGVADAVALGRALNRMPRRLTIIGVEPGDLEYGEGLSEPVQQSLTQAARLVLQELRREG